MASVLGTDCVHELILKVGVSINYTILGQTEIPKPAGQERFSSEALHLHRPAIPRRPKHSSKILKVAQRIRSLCPCQILNSTGSMQTRI
jgi:hypothetical protein